MHASKSSMKQAVALASSVSLSATSPLASARAIFRLGA
jgi:hypothetical protein